MTCAHLERQLAADAVPAELLRPSIRAARAAPLTEEQPATRKALFPQTCGVAPKPTRHLPRSRPEWTEYQATFLLAGKLSRA